LGYRCRHDFLLGLFPWDGLLMSAPETADVRVSEHSTDVRDSGQGADVRLDESIRRCKHDLEFDMCIRCVRAERDLYKFQAETNKATIEAMKSADYRKLGQYHGVGK
jgi:hypothetical protein